MKTLLILSLLGSFNSSHAQSYGADDRLQITAIETGIGAFAAYTYSRSAERLFWKKALPTEMEKLSATMAQRNSVREQLKAAEKAVATQKKVAQVSADAAEALKKAQAEVGTAKELLKKWDESVKKVSKELTIAKKAKLRSIGSGWVNQANTELATAEGFLEKAPWKLKRMAGNTAGTASVVGFKVLKIVRHGVVIYCIGNLVGRTYSLIADPNPLDNDGSDLEVIPADEAAQYLH